jgi:hypothetical protein
MSSKTKRLCSLVHERQPWNGHEQVYVCARWERLKAHELYAVAKSNGDFSAANRLVTKFVSENVLDRLIDDATPFILAKRPLLVGVPHPPFNDADGTSFELKENLKNAIPFQFGSHIARLLDGDLDTEITQIARVGRTKLNPFERFLYQPVYQGDVRRDAAYILVDDVYSRGGTLAALRSHIVSKGGTVCSFAVLASSSGQWSPLALKKETCERLLRLFGPSLDVFWSEEIGHDISCLTEAEGATLAVWAAHLEERGPALVQRLRNQLFAIAGQGLRRESHGRLR